MDHPLLANLCADWTLTDPRPLARTSNAMLWRVTGPEGPAVLKLLHDGAEHELPGFALLDWWHGLGAVRMLRHRDRALLMEWLDGPSLGSLSREGRDNDATRALADVLLLLHRPRNFAPEGLVPLEEWLAPLTQSAVLGWPQRTRADMVMAAGVARRLLASSPAPFPLHGDLHQDNVLQNGGTWKAIDPKGLWGDPAFDAANAFRNPAELQLLARNYDRIAFMARHLSERLGYSQMRLLGWAAVQAALSACWNREDARPVEDDLLILPRLLAAYAAAPA